MSNHIRARESVMIGTFSYPGNDASIEAGKMRIIIDYFLLHDPAFNQSMKLATLCILFKNSHAANDKLKFIVLGLNCYVYNEFHNI